jgi:hypothetical protein
VSRDHLKNIPTKDIFDANLDNWEFIWQSVVRWNSRMLCRLVIMYQVSKLYAIKLPILVSSSFNFDNENLLSVTRYVLYFILCCLFTNKCFLYEAKSFVHKMVNKFEPKLWYEFSLKLSIPFPRIWMTFNNEWMKDQKYSFQSCKRDPVIFRRFWLLRELYQWKKNLSDQTTFLGSETKQNNFILSCIDFLDCF